MNYFVIMIDYGRRGREAIVDPEMTKANVISRIRSGEYAPDRIIFAHEVIDFGDGHIHTSDVKDELIEAAGHVEVEPEVIDRQAMAWDRRRDLAKETV